MPKDAALIELLTDALFKSQKKLDKLYRQQCLLAEAVRGEAKVQYEARTRPLPQADNIDGVISRSKVSIFHAIAMAARKHRNANKIPDQWPVVWEVDIVMKNEQCEHRLRVDPKLYKARLPGGITRLAMF